MCWSNTTAANVAGTTYTNMGATLVGSNTSLDAAYVFPWNATARDMADTTNVPNVRSAISARTSTVCYMVGLSENIEIQTNSGCPWQWRRICFTVKGDMPGAAAGTTTYTPAFETSNGQMRVVNLLSGNRNTGAVYSLFEVLFRGQNSSDWTDCMIAKTDSNRVTIKYDKTRTIASGNEDGMIRSYKMWHPMHSNLHYNDDENGDKSTTRAGTAQGKAGMGDYYVLDIIRARIGATSSDQLVFTPHATLYWHEK